MTTTEKNTRIAEKQPQPAVGQAIVLDTLTDLRDAPPGTTFLIQKEVVDYDFNPRFRNGFTRAAFSRWRLRNTSIAT